MALLNKTKKSVGNLMPVIGIESSLESFIEPAQDNFHVLPNVPITKQKHAALS